MSNRKHEFLPRSHSAEYGDLDKSNWKDLRIKSNWEFIDPAIRDLIRVLNESRFVTFFSCSGGHRRNLNHGNTEHEGGCVSFFPPSGIAYKLYFELRNKFKRFEFDTITNTRDGSKRVESTELDWRLEQSRVSKRAYYYELFEEMKRIVRETKRTRRDLSFIKLSRLYGVSPI